MALTPDEALDAALGTHATARPDEWLELIEFAGRQNIEDGSGGAWWQLKLARTFDAAGRVEDESDATDPGPEERHAERLRIIEAWRKAFFGGPRPTPLTPPSSRAGRTTS